ncbi:hypothetical protein RJ639_021354 [Escallonia herrerae]|uniref:UBX domain-containing protein n=1 Tax=Escallonia herrerae TaxID=1293975 RepID=A0AA88V4G0_9ASTE|nr:hypothetical protein RJ639_021354 [Escallonia herrerae]
MNWRWKEGDGAQRHSLWEDLREVQDKRLLWCCIGGDFEFDYVVTNSRIVVLTDSQIINYDSVLFYRLLIQKTDKRPRLEGSANDGTLDKDLVWLKRPFDEEGISLTVQSYFGDKSSGLDAVCGLKVNLGKSDPTPSRKVPDIDSFAAICGLCAPSGTGVCLGIRNLELFNMALLAKWLGRFEADTYSIWRNVRACKYRGVLHPMAVACGRELEMVGTSSQGFVTAEILASSLEKAWLSLHIQETTATFLTAALASKNSEQLASQTANAAILEQGSSSSSSVPSTSTDKHINYSEATTLENPDVVKENKHCEHGVEEIRSKFCDEISPSSSELESGDIEQVLQATSLTDMVNESLNQMKIALDGTEVEDKCTVREDNLDVVGQHSGGNLEFQVIPTEASETAKDEKTEVSEIEKADVIHLNLRLPEGASLQERFSIMSTLRKVKDYVDENQESDVGLYDIAIPYPRKVFHDEDLSRTLSDLGLSNRQALIVVPRIRAFGQNKSKSSSHKQASSTSSVDSVNRSSDGYLSFMKRIMSYVNPLSYFGGSASSSDSMQESQSSMWQYSSNPALQHNLRSSGRNPVFSSNQSDTHATGGNNSKSRKQASPGFGSNIHTLKHDEEDSRFSDRNAFWNGNSTQYGGDTDGK